MELREQESYEPVDRRPLAGIRVLDVTRSIAGPWTARLLGDAGAEVIKVEGPPSGDMLRQYPVRTREYDSAFFRQANAGKKSIGINLHEPAGRALVGRLAAECDVVVQNMRPAAAERCGLTFGQLKKSRPSIIVCGISGYGQENLPERPGNDIAAQALSGIASLSGSPNREPIVSFWSLADTLTSIHSFNAICSALLARDRGEGGCFIDMAITRCAMQLHDVGPLVGRLRPEHPLLRAGRFHPFLVVRGVTRASDGLIAVSAFRTSRWRRLAKLLGEPFCEPEFDDPLIRLDAQAEIVERLDTVAQSYTVESLCDRLDQLQVPAAPIQRTFGQALSHLMESQNPILVSLPDENHPTGALGNTGVHPINGARRLRCGSPKLGGDGYDVCRDILQLPQEEVETLFLEGVLHAEPEVLGDIFGRTS